MNSQPGKTLSILFHFPWFPYPYWIQLKSNNTPKRSGSYTVKIRATFVFIYLPGGLVYFLVPDLITNTITYCYICLRLFSNKSPVSYLYIPFTHSFFLLCFLFCIPSRWRKVFWFFVCLFSHLRKYRFHLQDVSCHI